MALFGGAAFVNGQHNCNRTVAEVPQLRGLLAVADVIRIVSRTSRGTCRLETPCIAVLHAYYFVAQDHPGFSYYSLSLLCRWFRLLHHC